MNIIPSSSPRAVPSIHILDADASSTLLNDDMYTADMYSSFYAPEDTTLYSCSQALQPEYLPSNSSVELEEMTEFSHLSTTGQPFLSSPSYSIPFSGIMQENNTEGGLPSSSLGSPSPSSFGGSLSPLSFCDSSALSDTESPFSPSPTTPDDPFFWPSQSLPFIGSLSTESIHPCTSLVPQSGPSRPRSHSSPSTRRGPVASKAMLEANGRRRRHPAQFNCPECQQTFTALFSLKRHAQSHTGERPFACSVPGCTQRFFNSSDCKRHEKSKKRHKAQVMQ